MLRARIGVTLGANPPHVMDTTHMLCVHRCSKGWGDTSAAKGRDTRAADPCMQPGARARPCCYKNKILLHTPESSRVLADSLLFQLYEPAPERIAMIHKPKANATPFSAR